MGEFKPKLRALVIDDLKDMRIAVKEVLYDTNLADFDFTEVGNGSEAMDIFDPEKFDIIFVDWNMPKLNGLEFARHVRSLRSARHVAIVMITAEKTESKQIQAYEDARITCFITKPFTLEYIYDKLSPVIEGIIRCQEEAKTNLDLSKSIPQSINLPTKAPITGFFSRLLLGKE